MNTEHGVSVLDLRKRVETTAVNPLSEFHGLREVQNPVFAGLSFITFSSTDFFQNPFFFLQKQSPPKNTPV